MRRVSALVDVLLVIRNSSPATRSHPSISSSRPSPDFWTEPRGFQRSTRFRCRYGMRRHCLVVRRRSPSTTPRPLLSTSPAALSCTWTRCRESVRHRWKTSCYSVYRRGPARIHTGRCATRRCFRSSLPADWCHHRRRFSFPPLKCTFQSRSDSSSTLESSRASTACSWNSRVPAIAVSFTSR